MAGEFYCAIPNCSYYDERVKNIDSAENIFCTDECEEYFGNPKPPSINPINQMECGRFNCKNSIPPSVIYDCPGVCCSEDFPQPNFKLELKQAFEKPTPCCTCTKHQKKKYSQIDKWDLTAPFENTFKERAEKRERIERKREMERNQLLNQMRSKNKTR